MEIHGGRSDMSPTLDAETTEYEHEWVEPVSDDGDDFDNNNNSSEKDKRVVSLHSTVSFRGISAAGRCRPTREAPRKRTAWASEMPRRLSTSWADGSDE